MPTSAGPVVLVALENYTPDLMSGILHVARREEWRLLTISYWSGVIPEKIALAGALISGFYQSDLARELREMGCPIVRIGSLPHPDDNVLPAVLPDLDAAGALAAEHLVHRGFRKLACLGHNRSGQSEATTSGFRKRAAELGHSCQIMQLGNEAAANRRQKTGEWISSLPRPVGLSVYGEMEAGAVATICHNLGLMVPDQIGIVCHAENKSSPYSELALTPLTSVCVDAETMGGEAAGLLRRLMLGEAETSAQIMVPPFGVSERRSTDTMAISDPITAQALRFIWDNLESPIDVFAVSEVVGISRRSLERSFRRSLNRGVAEELRRKRLEAVAELLRTTDMTIAEISRRYCFSSRTCLHRDFKKAYNTTPRRYRHEADSRT